MVNIEIAYKNLASPYKMLPSLMPYDIRFSHSTCITNRKIDDRQTHISHPKLDVMSSNISSG